MKAQLLFYPVTEQLFVFKEGGSGTMPPVEKKIKKVKKRLKKAKKLLDILCSNDYYINYVNQPKEK